MNETLIRLLDMLEEGAYILDKNRCIVYWNEAAERISGYKSKEVIGRHCRDNILVHIDENGKELCHSGCPALACLQCGSTSKSKVYLHHADGHRVPVKVSVIPINNQTNDTSGVIEVFSLNEGKAVTMEDLKELLKLSYVDEKTTLLNRNYFKMRISKYLVETSPNKKEGKSDSGLQAEGMSIVAYHFKNGSTIKSRFGEEVLAKLCKIILQTTQANYEGENFTVLWNEFDIILLLPNVKRSLLLSVAEKLKLLYNASFLQIQNEKIYPQMVYRTAFLGEMAGPDMVYILVDQLFSELAGN